MTETEGNIMSTEENIMEPNTHYIAHVFSDSIYVTPADDGPAVLKINSDGFMYEELNGRCYLNEPAVKVALNAHGYYTAGMMRRVGVSGWTMRVTNDSPTGRAPGRLTPDARVPKLGV